MACLGCMQTSQVLTGCPPAGCKGKKPQPKPKHHTPCIYLLNLENGEFRLAGL